MTTVAIISDTHLPKGTRRIPERCLERLRTADAIIHAGDFLTLQALRELEALGPPVHAVHGNVDTADLREHLPRARLVRFGEVLIALTHVPGPSAGRLERLRKRFPDAHAVVFGHTHMPEHRERDGFQIFNPGSPTERRRAPARTMGIATVEAGRIQFELVVVG